jgi:hypothetical protein
MQIILRRRGRPVQTAGNEKPRRPDCGQARLWFQLRELNRRNRRFTRMRMFRFHLREHFLENVERNRRFLFRCD